MNWHSLDTRQLCKTYATGERSGLADYRCTVLRQKHGENVLTPPCRLSFFDYTKRALCSILSVNALLVFAAALGLACAGRLSPLWAAVACAASVCSVLLRALLRLRADRPLKRFDALSVPCAEVMRGGVLQRVDASQLVPGDLILLRVGDRVCADARLLECDDLRCDESVLTGRCRPLLKRADILLPERTAAADRVNMVFMGCEVVSGTARAVVTETGMRTELGRLLASMQCERQTPARGRFWDYAGTAAVGGAVLALLFFAAYGLTGGSEGLAWEALGCMLCALSLLPLTAAEAAVMRMGERRLALRHALIKRTGTLNTLSRVSVICTEMEGVFTQNKLSVETLWAYGEISPFSARLDGNALALLKLGALCSNAVITFEDGEEIRQGSPAEIAMLDAAMYNGLKPEELYARYPRVCELPYTADRMRMAAVHRIDGVPVLIVKGGLDAVLPLCAQGAYEKALAAHEKLCARELRVVAVACKELSSPPVNPDAEELEQGLTLAGLIGLADQPRPDAKRAVRACREAGVRTVIMTDCYNQSAEAAARSLGLLGENSHAVTTGQLAAMSDDELADAVEHCTVYTRLHEQDKARVIRALKQQGRTVLTIGSGMRDLPALKEADAACCMHECSGDGLKSVCDLLITDNRFATVLAAIRESRLVCENLRTAARYLLAACFSLLFACAAGFVFGQPLVFPPQVLLINLVVGLFFTVALGTEPTGQSMRGPVISQSFSVGFWLPPLLKGALTAVFAVGAYLVGAKLFITDLMEPSHTAGAVMAFYVLLLGQCPLAGSFRRPADAGSSGLLTSPFFNAAVMLTVALWLCACLVPPVGARLSLVPVSIVHTAAAAAIALVQAGLLALLELPALVRGGMTHRFG